MLQHLRCCRLDLINCSWFVQYSLRATWCKHAVTHVQKYLGADTDTRPWNCKRVPETFLWVNSRVISFIKSQVAPVSISSHILIISIRTYVAYPLPSQQLILHNIVISKYFIMEYPSFINHDYLRGCYYVERTFIGMKVRRQNTCIYVYYISHSFIILGILGWPAGKPA